MQTPRESHEFHLAAQSFSILKTVSLMIFIQLFQLNDAYEEVDEQRQVVAQWKRKTQKVQGEMNDTKLLLEEQTSRNVLLEKKQRKFDSELALLQEDRKAETSAKDKLQKEVDQLKSAKYQAEEQLHVSTFFS